MRISVVMATYNGEKYLRAQMDSIRTQTKQPDEVIICDDCSSDRTIEILRDYIKSYDLQNTWKLVLNSRNIGYANNFKKGLDLAKGEFIYFSDQDDIWNKEKIDIMQNIIEKTSDCKVLCTDYESFVSNDDAKVRLKRNYKQTANDGSLEKILLSKKSVYLRSLGCCMCVRKDFVKQIDSYLFDGWAHDDCMWRLAQCMDGCYLLHSNLVRHRVHENNTATYGQYHTRNKRIKLFQAMQRANKQMLKMMEDCGANWEKKHIIEKHISMMVLRLDLLRNRKIGNSFMLIKYLNYYQSIKSMFLEICIALRGSK